MRRVRIVPPARIVLILGCATAVLAGMTTVALGGPTLGGRDASALAASHLEVSHLPPLLTAPGESVTLEYEAFCVGGGEPADDGACSVGGTVHASTAGGRRSLVLPLEPVLSPVGRRLVARVPADIAGAPGGFEYFAVLQEDGAGPITVPAGGSKAPHRSIRLVDAVDVELGAHVFRKPRAASERAAEASWGDKASQIGLEEGRNLSPIGASAFDVGRAGTVYVLDEAKRRVLRWRRGASTPEHVPVSIAGTLADLIASSDGTLYVLETVGRPGATPLVRRFDADGRELERVAIAERTGSQIRQGEQGPVVLQQPSHQWMPVTADGTIAGPSIQRENGSVERPLAGGRSVTVLRTANEIRVALVGPAGSRRAWRLHSATALGEVQLAEPVGNRLVLVARVYTETEAEFVVLVLGDRELVDRFSLAAAEWAESAPLGRFKLVGSSLYRLGSTAKGAFVDRYDLEVR